MEGVEKSTLLWLSRAAGKEKLCILLLLAEQILLGGSSVLYAVFLQKLVDEAAAGNGEGLLAAVIRVIVLVGIQLGLRASGRFLDEWCRASLENRFKRRLFSCLLGKAYADTARIHSGEWMNRLTSDTAVAANGLTQILPGAAGMAVKLAGAFCVLWLLEPRFAALLIPGAGLLLVFTGIFRKTLKKLHGQVQEADGALRIFLQERLESQVLVRTFVREEWTEQAAAERMETHKRMRMKRNHISNLCNAGFGAAIHGAYALSAAYCGYGILKGTMSYGTFTAILQMMSQMQAPFAGLTGFLPQYYAMAASAERLREAEGFAGEEKNGKSQEELLWFYRREFKKLVFEKVSFTYEPPVKDPAGGRTVVLEDLQLAVDKGDCAALTGGSGGGKSTFLKLLLCLYPADTGAIYLLGEEKLPLTAAWRGLFAYVPQRNQLLSGTIREIVAFGDEEGMKKERELKQALRLACAEEFVGKLEKGIDTVLGEHGAGLSEGQLQRIAIARALFSERPILLLDESTSALDEETEERLLMNIKRMTDKTVLIVTHRPKVLSICNKQVIFENHSAFVQRI